MLAGFHQMDEAGSSQKRVVVKYEWGRNGVLTAPAALPTLRTIWLMVPRSNHVMQRR